jgi:RNA polymerase sigma-70 factor (ECF subfamily)
LLRSSHKTRVDYVGTWLPEPVHTRTDSTPEQAQELASSLSTAFLLVLQRLAPKERAAYLLYEIFDLPYADVAATLGLKEVACRKLVSRARAHVVQQEARFTTARERQSELLQAFHVAIQTGATSGLAALLADEVAMCADSGGKVPTIARTLHGKAEVLAYITEQLRGHWLPYEWRVAEINGNCGVLLWADDHAAASMTFGYDASGRACDIYIMRNPDKLVGLGGEEVFLP